jgi:pilus assembly protein CpaC
MRGRRLVQASIIPAILILVALAWLPRPCKASDEARSVDAAAAEKLNLVVGKSVVVQSKAPVRRVSIAAPEIADAVVLSPRQIYLTGKTAGVTNMIMWGESDKVTAIFDVEVGPDVMTLKTKLHEMFPGEKGVLVTAARDGITLAGSVSGMTRMAQIIALAETYAPLDKTGKPKVTNLLEVSGVHQVMLEVRVSEMSRSLARNLGINFNVISASGRQLGLSLLDGLTSLPSSGGFPADPLQVSSNVNAILRFLGNGATWTVFVDALKENGLLHVLAEPTLITLSGKSANFLAGGEFPVPVPQSGTSTNTITIEYKSFGVALSFTPTVLMDGRINMVVAPEVSELDFSTAVSLQGFIIPGVTTRRVSTTVELADGQSFAIAGLIRQDVREDIKKFPLLGDIPILGPLFRSSSFNKNETELVVIVTPHLVKPMDVAKQTLPTDAFNEPDDFEFYVEGKTEGKGKGEKVPALPRAVRRGGLEGDFGYIIP